MPSSKNSSRTTPPSDPSTRILVKDLEKGFRVDQIFLVENSNFKQTRNSKYFIQADLRDRTGSIRAIRWEADRELYESFGPDDFLHVSGRVEEFQQHLQIIMDKLRKVDDSDVDLEGFLPVSERNIDEMSAELQAIVESLGDQNLKALLNAFLVDPEVRDGLRRCPAGKSLHHASVGGLLEHVTSMARSAKLICPNYPQLNRDVLLAGVVLHDIGKLRELSFLRSFHYTDAGQLLGHIAIGIAWVQEKARALEGFPPQLLNQVLHLIASHHGQAEYGAVKSPMTQEAVVLHYLDNIDAKLAIFRTVQKEQRLGRDGAQSGPAQNWSVWHPAMGRRLYFP